jgi:hypothetical protein
MANKPHELRIKLLNPHGATPEDTAIIETLASVPPKTKFQPGDLALLIEVPKHLQHVELVPRMWEVRFVVSRYQFEFHRLLHQTGGMHDFAIAQIEAARRLPRNRWADPVVYAHAFPHGEWPSSAEWFPGHCLQRLTMRAPTEEWEPILDEFSSPFVGYDPSMFGAGVVLDLAPDIYGDQRNRKRPLVFEEDAFHRVCLFGLEEESMVAVPPYELDLAAYDYFGDRREDPGPMIVDEETFSIE